MDGSLLLAYRELATLTRGRGVDGGADRKMLARIRQLLMPWLSGGTPVVVAVSGGADSLALTLLVDESLRDMGLDPHLLHSVTVDHRLREESTEEAATVHSWLTERGIRHTTLAWDHGPITSGVEAKAREARYRLLTAYCRQNEVPTLMTAHHALDHLETFFMHLSRGSNLEGLCGIRTCSVCQGVTLVRPLLAVFPDDLKKILEEHFYQEFVTDPSNDSLLLERVRWRYLLKETPLLKEALPHVLRSLDSLNSLSNEIDNAAELFIQMHGEPFEEGVLLPKRLWTNLPSPIGDRVLKKLIQRVAPTERPWPHSCLERLGHKIRQPHFKGATAHHCVLRAVKGGRLSLQKEHRSLQKK